MKAWEILITLIVFSVSLIVYYSMFGSVVTAVTGSVANWSCIGTSVNATTCLGATGTNMSWLPGILVILAALMPLFALVTTLWVELGMK